MAHPAPTRVILGVLVALTLLATPSMGQSPSGLAAAEVTVQDDAQASVMRANSVKLESLNRAIGNLEHVLQVLNGESASTF